jgi:hypothetical protein
VATLLAAGGVVEVLRWVHVLAWRVALPPAVPWTALVPGALLFSGGFLGFNLAVAELNATPWERRPQRRRPNAPPP